MLASRELKGRVVWRVRNQPLRLLIPSPRSSSSHPGMYDGKTTTLLETKCLRNSPETKCTPLLRTLGLR